MRVVILNSEFMGHGDNTLGEKLMGSFLRKVWSFEKKPGAIIFYNSAVKLLAEGSDVLDALNGLFESGVDLLACGTCVTHFGLNDKVAVGRVSDMQEIATLLTTADHVSTV